MTYVWKCRRSAHYAAQGSIHAASVCTPDSPHAFDWQCGWVPKAPSIQPDEIESGYIDENAWRLIVVVYVVLFAIGALSIVLGVINS